jgi:hypothetical protein
MYFLYIKISYIFKMIFVRNQILGVPDALSSV